MPNIRKPTSINKLNGTYRPDRHGTDDTELVIDDPLPPPPDWMNPVAVNEWHRIRGLLEPHGVLKATDYAVMIAYCTQFEQISQLKGHIAPQVITQFRHLMNDLGLTPVSRGKVRTPKKAKKGNGFSDI